jgi:hypothetical protein
MAKDIPPTPRLRLAIGLAWIIGATCILLVIAGLCFYVLNDTTPGMAEKFFPSEPVGGVAFALLGILVVARLPNNRVGWLFFAISLSAALALFTDQYASYTLVTHPAPLPFVWLVGWARTWIWLVGNCAIGLLALLFPTGRLLSPRWRWVVWLLVGSCSAFAGEIIAVDWGMTAQQMHQFTDSQLAPILQILGSGFTLAMFGSYIVAAISLFIRLHRARGVERQQMKWFTFAVGLLVLSIVVANVAQAIWPAQSLDALSKIVQALFLAGMAVAIGMGILQHRLFDIDLIIRRTLVYSLLSLTLVLVYFGSVVMLETFFHGLTGQGENQVVIVISTLVIAALFTPLRRRVQDGIDRRFYRRKYDAEQVLAAFGETVRNETDLDQLAARLVQVVQETMQSEPVSLWLKNRPQFNERKSP